MSSLPPPPPTGGSPLPPPQRPTSPFQPSASTPLPVAAEPIPPRRRMPRWAWGLVGALVVAGVVVAIVLTTGSDDKPATVATTAITTVPISPTGSTTPDTATTEPGTTTADTAADTTVAAPAGDVVDGAPAGATGDRDNPVPVGEIADIGGGWRLQVLAVVTDGAALVAAENEFNDPPPAGSTFSLVKVALGYFGVDDPKSGFEPTISAVGAANVELDGDCGLIPEQLDQFVDVFAGGVVVGNLCFVTTPADAGALQLYAVGDLFGEGESVFLAASETPSPVTPMPALQGPQPGAAATSARQSATALGTAGDVGGGWTLTVTGAATDITDQVHAENQFNDPPPAGYRFIGVPVTFAFAGEGSASAFDVTAKAVGDGNVELPQSCGVIPGEVDQFSDVFSGGSVSGMLCFVAPADSPGLVLYATADFGTTPLMFATA